MSKDKKISDDIEDLLDDDDIRKFFQGRDPDRPKVYPFLDPDVEESIRGKASTLTPKEVVEDKEKVYGISYTQHTKHIRDVARHFFLVGSAVALILAIVLAAIL